MNFLKGLSKKFREYCFVVLHMVHKLSADLQGHAAEPRAHGEPQRCGGGGGGGRAVLALGMDVSGRDGGRGAGWFSSSRCSHVTRGSSIPQSVSVFFGLPL